MWTMTTRRPYGSGSLRERDGKWISQIRHPISGKMVSRTHPAGLSPTQIERAHRAWVAEVRSSVIAPSAITLRRHCDEWLATRDDLSHGTVANYRICLERFGDLLDQPVQQITVRQLDQALSDLRRRYSPATAAATRSVLHAALERAVAWELIEANPLLRTTPVRTKTQTRREVLTIDVLRDVIAAEPSTMWRALWVTLAGTGMRPGEALALAWGHVDLTAGEISVERTVTDGADGRKVLGDATKTRRWRPVPVGADVVGALRAWRLEVAESSLHRVAPERLIWSTRWKSGQPMNPRSVADAWEAALERAKAPRVTVGSLRHLHASTLLAAGVPPQQVADRLGHSIQQTMNRYGVHVPDASRRAVLDALPAMADDHTG